jgi:hypothetical protein
MINFKSEYGFKIKNKYFPAISMVLYIAFAPEKDT